MDHWGFGGMDCGVSNFELMNYLYGDRCVPHQKENVSR